MIMGAQPPKVFISYAWSSPEHDEWVVRLATRLEENGVAVVLDKWDLKPGQDKYAFMERMATSSEVDKILVICDRVYKNKADDRTGGVGTETQILSQDVYEKVGQDRVIPIIAEKDEDGKYLVPTYIRNRIFIDLSSEDLYEQGYEQLLRHLFNRPLHRRPERGVAPSFLFEDAPSHIKTTNLNAQIKDAIQRNPARVKSLSQDFINAFSDTLTGYTYERVEGKELDDIIVENIHNMIPLRDDFVRFIELQCEFQETLDTQLVVGFFERMIAFTRPPESAGSYDRRQFDHYKFLLRELFLFTVMVLIEKSRFNNLELLLRSTFFISRHGRLEPANYDALHMRCDSIDDRRNQRLNLRKLCLTAEILVMEHTTKSYGKQQMISADLLLYYISVTCNKDSWNWYPITYVYGEYMLIPLVQKMQSHAFADKVKGLFGATSVEDVKRRFSSFENVHKGFQYTHIQTLQDQLAPDKIGIVP